MPFGLSTGSAAPYRQASRGKKFGSQRFFRQRSRNRTAAKAQGVRGMYEVGISPAAKQAFEDYMLLLLSDKGIGTAEKFLLGASRGSENFGFLGGEFPASGERRKQISKDERFIEVFDILAAIFSVWAGIFDGEYRNLREKLSFLILLLARG